MDRGAWQATVHGVSKSWTRLSIHIQWLGMLGTFSCTCLSSVCLFRKNIVSVPVSILNRIVWVFCYWRVWCCVFLISFTLFFFNVYFYLFIWLCQVLVVACRILDLRCDMWDFFSFLLLLLFFFSVMTCELSYRLWDLVPWPGMELGHPEWARRVPATEPPCESSLNLFWFSVYVIRLDLCD